MVRVREGPGTRVRVDRATDRHSDVLTDGQTDSLTDTRTFAAFSTSAQSALSAPSGRVVRSRATTMSAIDVVSCLVSSTQVRSEDSFLTCQGTQSGCLCRSGELGNGVLRRRGLTGCPDEPDGRTDIRTLNTAPTTSTSSRRCVNAATASHSALTTTSFDSQAVLARPVMTDAST